MKNINYKVIDLFELYDFDIKWVFIGDRKKKDDSFHMMIFSGGPIVFLMISKNVWTFNMPLEKDEALVQIISIVVIIERKRK